MILAVHQPQYLPWLGYFHKIARSELFIFLDDVQYKKREFQNRNKIRTAQGAQWLTVPVLTKDAYTQNIRDVRIQNDTDWAGDHWKSLEQHYHKARFFADYSGFFKGLYAQRWDSLMDLSLAVIRFVMAELGIATPCRMSSEFGVTTASTERIVDLCRAAGAGAYLSGAGGRDYMDASLFEKHRIALSFQEFTHPVYPQVYPGFESHLSIVDLLFNCGRESRALLLGDAKPS